MSPSLGPINQNLLMTSEYFLAPMAPDYFSVMATDSLASVLPKWKAWASQAQSLSVLQKATYPFPSIQPKFLGTVIQKYRIREGTTPSSAFQRWINEIQEGVKQKLIPALSRSDMLLPKEAYESIDLKDGTPLLQMSDFNSLIALSQEHKVPVFALSDHQIGQNGIVLKRTKESMNKFGNLFSEAADRIIALTEYAKGT